MAMKNKLNITDQVELARAEEKISKAKANEMFESGFLTRLNAGTFEALAKIHAYLFGDKLKEVHDVVSGTVDLLIETAEGYWIIDHKSDTVTDFNAQFVHHYPQLEANAKYTALDKPFLGVGINWVRYGKLSVYEY